MARTGVSEMDPGAAVVELKRELKRVVKVIVEEEELDLDVIDRAKDVLFALRDLKAKRAAATAVMAATAVVEEERESAVAVPEEFRCPLSKEVMRDPVIVATGQTYDRPFIQRWLKAGHRTCPLTQQVLSHTLLTPNYLVSELISQWFKTHGLDPPGPTPQLNEDDITDADRDHFFSLLEKMSSPVLEQQKAAAKEVRLLTKRIPAFRALFGESPNAIHQLLNPLRNSFVIDHNQDLQEDIITTLLNISIHDSNKKLVAETPMVIPLLINALTRGPIETRSNSAATLFTLSALDSNKDLIGKSGALKPLLDLIDEGHPLAIKDAASAVFNLCINQENRARAVRDGAAIRVILSKITNGVHVDELLAILAMLSTNHRAVEELTQLGAISILLSIMKETSCGRNKENCIAILYAICVNDRSRLREMREEERENGTLSQLAQDGTSRAKRKATGILDRLNRAVHFTHTA